MNIYCLSVIGPCENQCPQCLDSLNRYYDEEKEKHIKKAKQLLEYYGYKVTLEEENVKN